MKKEAPKAFIGQGTAAVVTLSKVKSFVGRGTAATVTAVKHQGKVRTGP